MKLSKIFTLASVMLCLSMAAFAKVKVVTTIFPEYDWVKQIAGEKSANIDLTLLMDNGVDLHSFQPSVKDIAKISNADIFIYVGGESDEWVEGVLKSAKNKKLLSINLLEILEGKLHEEEVIEGMECEEEDEEDGAEEEKEYDEHVWLSLKNAKILCNAITEALCQKDAENAALYKKNYAAYSAKLDSLDKEYADCVKNAKRKTVLFGDRFPFRYMIEDYKLNYYAAFLGCSAETEASFKTVLFLAKKTDELKLPYILQIETSDGKLASTILKNSKSKNTKILTIDSLQSTTSSDIKNGASYINSMKKNLETLKLALN